jgi:hypothetical protein
MRASVVALISGAYSFVVVHGRYLALGNMRDANALHSFYTSYRQSKQLEPTALLNYIRFVLLVLERDAPQIFVSLKEVYLPSLNRDSELVQVSPRRSWWHAHTTSTVLTALLISSWSIPLQSDTIELHRAELPVPEECKACWQT